MGKSAKDLASGRRKCLVAWLTGLLGMGGLGKVVHTTVWGLWAPSPLDRVNRTFNIDRRNQFWVSNFAMMPTWQSGLYAALATDVCARRIVGQGVCTRQHG